MFRKIIEFITGLFSVPSLFEELERYIIAGNPQTPADVEQLERGFYNRQQRQTLWHFHE